MKAELLNQTARVTNEVGGGATTGLPSDPGQRTNVALDFKLDINAEQGGEQLLCDAAVMFLAQP
jgi:hypothetical protein